MKRALLALALVVIPMLAQAGDFEITVQRKKEGLTPAKGGTRLKSSQNWIGEVKVEYHAFKPSPELEARYIIFVKRQKIGQKQGEDEVEKVKGTATVAITPGAPTTFYTSEVALYQAHMAPGWVPREGGMQRAEDSVLGVWVKLFNGTTEVGEHVNPTTLAAKFHWED